MNATGLASQHIFRDRFGFRERAAVRYRAYHYHGHPVLASIQEPEAVLLLDQPLAPASARGAATA